MSTEKRADEVSNRLGYLLKHVHLRFAELTAASLAPHGVGGRELAVLRVLATYEPTSQQEAARRLGIDRTTMVALIDALARKCLVARRPDRDDRRRNVIELTLAGHKALEHGTRASDEAARQFLAPLSAQDAHQFRRSLSALALHEPGPDLRPP